MAKKTKKLSPARIDKQSIEAVAIRFRQLDEDLWNCWAWKDMWEHVERARQHVTGDSYQSFNPVLLEIHLGNALERIKKRASEFVAEEEPSAFAHLQWMSIVGRYEVFIRKPPLTNIIDSEPFATRELTPEDFMPYEPSEEELKKATEYDPIQEIWEEEAEEGWNLHIQPRLITFFQSLVEYLRTLGQKLLPTANIDTNGQLAHLKWLGEVRVLGWLFKELAENGWIEAPRHRTTRGSTVPPNSVNAEEWSLIIAQVFKENDGTLHNAMKPEGQTFDPGDPKHEDHWSIPVCKTPRRKRSGSVR